MAADLKDPSCSRRMKVFLFLIPVDKDPEQRTPECIRKHPELREALYSLTPPRRAPWRPPPAPCPPPVAPPGQPLVARGWVPAGRGCRGPGWLRASPGRQGWGLPPALLLSAQSAPFLVPGTVLAPLSLRASGIRSANSGSENSATDLLLNACVTLRYAQRNTQKKHSEREPSNMQIHLSALSPFLQVRTSLDWITWMGETFAIFKLSSTPTFSSDTGNGSPLFS